MVTDTIENCCSYCKSPGATKKCGGCKQAWYCSRECQVTHYKVHKHECKKLRTRNTGEGALELDDEDIVKLKNDFDAICVKYDFRNDEMSSKLADFLSNTDNGAISSSTFAHEFKMDPSDANKFLMWIQIGTRFKNQVIDRNAELLANEMK